MEVFLASDFSSNNNEYVKSHLIYVYQKSEYCMQVLLSLKKPPYFSAISIESTFMRNSLFHQGGIRKFEHNFS